MQLEIRHGRGRLDDEARSHIERRLGFALDRFARRVDRVTVFVSDENGPRGGDDMRCRIVVNLPAEEPVVVDATRSELAAAIDHAAHRACHAVGKVLDRRRDHRHGGGAGSGPR
ncbi:HPF/RaiA family ribosome-associated protein [Tautonia sociabilis]|uniref:HPF/RaiA family ribosome-associated protein n=1 Tax=Tautonia sociabilis TaxID=2080755 RepID=A0A432MMY0_9BACT|nr:HPF/RaiA family ribosome-associated protein [Tautonia sociabilis]RUL88804.1 HPF/RaiA family ribosome-associated protein [Tautonia sociabilis]